MDCKLQVYHDDTPSTMKQPSNEIYSPYGRKIVEYYRARSLLY